MTDTLEDAPLSDTTLAGMRPMPLAKRARLRAGLSQQAFAEVYGLPVGSLRDWEQRRSEPDAAAVAYLTAIANEPEAVAAAYNKSAAA